MKEEASLEYKKAYDLFIDVNTKTDALNKERKIFIENIVKADACTQICFEQWKNNKK